MKKRFTLDDIFVAGYTYAIRFRKRKKEEFEYDWALSMWSGSSWEDCTSPNHRAEKMIASGWKAIEFIQLTEDE